MRQIKENQLAVFVCQFALDDDMTQGSTGSSGDATACRPKQREHVMSGASATITTRARCLVDGTCTPARNLPDFQPWHVTIAQTRRRG